MFLNRIIFYIALFCSVSLAAQNTDKGEVAYLDFDGNPTTKENAAFYEFKTLLKPEIYKYQKYFLNNYKAYLVEKYYYDSKGSKQGKYTSYYKDGIIKTEGIYKDDQKYGPWKKYNKVSDVLSDTPDNSVYLKNLFYYKNDKKDGKFKEYYYDGNLQAEGMYKEGHFIGECKWYFKNGQVSSQEIYDNNGKLKEINQWDEDGVTSKVKKKSSHDIKSMKKELGSEISRYIRQNFDHNLYKQYPKPSGVVYTKILLDKNGKIHALKSYSTGNILKVYEEEIKRIIEHMPRQKPFFYHNQLTAVIITLPVKFNNSKG